MRRTRAFAEQTVSHLLSFVGRLVLAIATDYVGGFCQPAAAYVRAMRLACNLDCMDARAEQSPDEEKEKASHCHCRRTGSRGENGRNLSVQNGPDLWLWRHHRHGWRKFARVCLDGGMKKVCLLKMILSDAVSKEACQKRRASPFSGSAQRQGYIWHFGEYIRVVGPMDQSCGRRYP